MLKSFVVALMALCCITVKAQTFGGDHDTVRTIAGTLQISKIVRPGSDGVTFDVELDGKPFDQLYGSRYVYYPDSKDQDKAVSRMIMEDFSGGFSDPPTVSIYDFRQKKRRRPTDQRQTGCSRHSMATQPCATECGRAVVRFREWKAGGDA